MRPTWLALVVLLLLAVAAVAAACQREEEVANPRSQELLQTPAAVPTPTVPPATPPAATPATAGTLTFTPLTQDGISGNPLWSPDGSLIAFTKAAQLFTPAVHPEVWVMNADGSSPRKLADRGRPVSWSPDGQRLAIIIQPGQVVTEQDKVASVAVVGLDGSFRDLGPVDYEVPSAHWLSAAELLVSRNGSFVAVDVQSGGSRTVRTVGIPKEAARGFVLSPDQRWVAFSSSEGLAVAPLSEGPAAILSRVWDSMAWSLDSTRLAYSSGNTLFVATPDGTTTQQIYGGRGPPIRNIHWLQSGRVFFQTGPGRGYDAISFTINPDGTDVRTLMYDLSGVQFSPSEDRVAVGLSRNPEAEVNKFDIWVASWPP